MGKNRAVRTAARNAADAENMDNQSVKQTLQTTIQQSNMHSNRQIQLAMAQANDSDDEDSVKQSRAEHRANQLPVTFAQKLAHPEKKIRDANLKRVKMFVQTSPSINQIGLSKLFKGMFYCYWLSDSQPVQMDLAERLSSVMDECNEERFELYLRCFLEMMDREWTGIDRLRMDKFMSWVRIFFNHSLTFLHTHSWSEELIKRCVEIHAEVPLCSTTLGQRRGLFLFYTDIFLVEIEKVINLSNKPLTFDQFIHFLTPYQQVIFTCRDASLISRVEDAIFDKLVDSAESDEHTPFIKTIRSNSQRFADWFTTLAAHASTPSKHRKSLYKYSDCFTAVAQTLGTKQTSKQSSQSLKQSIKQAMDSNKRKQSSTQPDSVSSKRQKLNGQPSNETDAADVDMNENGLIDGQDMDSEDDADYEQADDAEFDEDDESDDEELEDELDESIDQSVDQSIEDAIAQSINESIDESNMVLNDESPVEPVDDDGEVPEIEEEGADLVASADDTLFMTADSFDAISTPPQSSKKSNKQAQSAKPSSVHSPSKLDHAKDAVEMLHDQQDHVTPPKHQQSPIKKLRPAQPKQTNDQINAQSPPQPANGIFATPKHKRPESASPPTNAKSPPPRTPRSVRIDESRNDVKEFDKRKVLDSAGKPVLLTKPSPRPAISRKSLEAFNQLAKNGGHLKKPSPKRRVSMSSNVSK